MAKEMERCAPRWGVRVYLSDDGKAFQGMVALDENGAVISGLEQRGFAGDLGVRLSPDNANRIRDDSRALYNSYRSLASDEGDRYFLSVGFAPT